MEDMVDTEEVEATVDPEDTEVTQATVVTEVMEEDMVDTVVTVAPVTQIIIRILIQITYKDLLTIKDKVTMDIQVALDGMGTMVILITMPIAGLQPEILDLFPQEFLQVMQAQMLMQD